MHDGTIIDLRLCGQALCPSLDQALSLAPSLSRFPQYLSVSLSLSLPCPLSLGLLPPRTPSPSLWVSPELVLRICK
eukprot:11166635-Lingulodinium_polyedra.AAC.1